MPGRSASWHQQWQPQGNHPLIGHPRHPPGDLKSPAMWLVAQACKDAPDPLFLCVVAEDCGFASRGWAEWAPFGETFSNLPMEISTCVCTTDPPRTTCEVKSFGEVNHSATSASCQFEALRRSLFSFPVDAIRCCIISSSTSGLADITSHSSPFFFCLDSPGSGLGPRPAFYPLTSHHNFYNLPLQKIVLGPLPELILPCFLKDCRYPWSQGAYSASPSVNQHYAAMRQPSPNPVPRAVGFPPTCS